MSTPATPLDLEAERKARKLSRNALAELLGWTLTRVWNVEKGTSKPLTDEERAHALLTLNGSVATGPAADPEVSIVAPEDDPDDTSIVKARARITKSCPAGATRLLEWEGVSYGDRVRVQGEPGLWVFQYHHTGPTGAEYVTVFGGPKGHASMRSFRPERVMSSSRRNISSQGVDI